MLLIVIYSNFALGSERAHKFLKKIFKKIALYEPFEKTLLK